MKRLFLALAFVLGVSGCGPVDEPPKDPELATCDDGILNHGETAVDCGGAGNGCPRCPDGSWCQEDADCASGFCHLGNPNVWQDNVCR